MDVHQATAAEPHGRTRRWRFAGATFDEASRALTVDGRRATLETKPLELLRLLLQRAGEVVTKDELFDAVWPDVTVVEASLPSAIFKLRRALGDTARDAPIIETLPRVGYRLAVPVEVVRSEDPGQAPTRRRGGRGGATVGLALLAAAATSSVLIAASSHVRPVSRTEAIDALRRLDSAQIREMLARGWDPNAPLDRDRNPAMVFALENCEFNPGHDRQQLLYVVRMLLDAQARIDLRNAFGDTPYSIAAAPRFCGPDHPVTRMLRTLCRSGAHPLGDRCMARYDGPRR